MKFSTCVLICVLTSCHLCQLITDLRRCRTYLYFLTFVCLLVVYLLIRNFPLSLNILDIQRERYFISKTENRHLTTNTQMYKIKDSSYTYEGQLSTDKDARKLGHILGHMLKIPFPVWAGIEINSSQNWIWN